MARPRGYSSHWLAPPDLGEELPTVTIRYIGLLANVDESILEFGRIAGFEVKSLESNELHALISTSPNLANRGLGILLMDELHVVPYVGSRAFALTDSVQGEVSADLLPNWRPSAVFLALGNRADLIPAHLRRLRLLHEGNIAVPFRGYWAETATGFAPLGTELPGSLIVAAPFSTAGVDPNLLEREVEDLPDELPHAYLNRAWDALELSYQTTNLGLQFLSLMTGLEAIFNLGLGELTYRIRRGVAVLTGQDPRESVETFATLGDLYQRRSQMSHGKSDVEATAEEVRSVRGYLRNSILRATALGYANPRELDVVLSRSGFGAGPTLPVKSPNSPGNEPAAGNRDVDGRSPGRADRPSATSADSPR